LAATYLQGAASGCGVEPVRLKFIVSIDFNIGSGIPTSPAL
jgi:hypothetical protein